MNTEKRCRICGDQATGFNYQGLSCASCKIFFHRYAPKSEKLNCRFGGNCSIDIASRNLCQRCRLEKCLQMGMIQRKTVFTKMKVDKHKKMNSLSSSSVENALEKNILKSITLFDLHQAKESKNTFSRMRNAKDASLELNAFEKTLIEEIQRAMTVFVDAHSVEIVGIMTNLIMECIEMPSIHIRWTVKFCKKFAAFTCLNAADQLNLLKHFCYDILTVRWAFAFCPAKNGAPYIINETGDQAKWMNFDCVKQMQDQEIVKGQVNYIKELNAELENDRTMHDLLCAQMLFSPRKELSRPEFIQYQNVFYGRLLRRYLQHKYRSMVKANQKFAALMGLIGQLPKIKENDIYIRKTELRIRNLEIHHLPDLLIEIYDI